MSLRVWLPLNGDLRNNGLSNITSVDANLTIDNVGKIGKCYSFNGSSSKITNTFSSPISSSIGSLACWVKFNAFPENKKWYTLLQLGNLGGYATCRFGLYMEYTDKICVSVDGSSQKNLYTHSLQINQWYHICTTYDGNIIKLYIDGTEVMSVTAIKGTYTTDSSYLYIGATNNYWLNGYMNDARYYDHALSAKEVKELSKGLVCHYPLNDIKGQENLFNWGNKGNKIITLNNYQNTGSFTQFNNCLTFDAKDTVGTTYTISFWAKSPNGTTALQLYNNNSTPRYFYFSPTTLTTSLNNEWQYFTYTFTNQDRGSGTTTASTYNRIEIYMPSKMGGQVKLIKIEEGEKATSWSPAPSDAYYNKLGYDKNIIYDTSGHNYNGINYNSFISNNSSKYSNSTFFDGSNSYIEFDNLDFMANMLPDEWSFSFWVYNQDSGDRSILFSNYGLGGVGGASFGFEKATNELLRVSYNNGTFDRVIPNSTLTVNDWTHIIVTKTKEHLISVYRNGVFIYSYTNDKCNSLGKIYRLGRDSRSDSTMFKGGISDFRIYTTVLSEDDVKELYQVGASIDKNGNVFAYEVKED